MSVWATFIGSGDAFGSGGRFQACIMVDHSTGRFLLDCGATSIVALKQAQIETRTIDTVFVSHLHGDHFGGIPFLVLDGQFSRREKDLVVAGPAGSKERTRVLMETLFPGSSTTERRFALDVREIAPGEAEIDGVRVKTFLAAHGSGAPPHSYRVEVDGVVIAYSGDTAWTESIPEIAAGADLFICEAYTLDRPVPNHLTVAQLNEHRGQLTPKRTILTHMTSQVLEAEDIGWERAHDGMVIQLG